MTYTQNQRSVANFCAGPANLPTAVLEKAQQEMLNWRGMGVSVMEISHRSPEFMDMAAKAESDLRALMNIPENYKVLFVQGGASLQFAAVPLNLFGKNAKGSYIDTGVWSTKAIVEAQRFGEVSVAASTKDEGYKRVPTQDELNIADDAAYLHYCPNETIGGVYFDYVPVTDKPLVADFSSCILSEEIDVSKFAVIYAGAQKNIGPAGITIVIVRDDVLEQAMPACPNILTYKNQAKSDSMLNTPATYSWYLSGLVFEWLQEQGGVSAIAEQNHKKAELLYSFIDKSSFYSNDVAKNNRSLMNVPFFIDTHTDENELNQKFLQESKQAGLLNLKGHRVVGGMRASIYNAITLEQVQALVDFMATFEKKYG